jgi:hypothetical protein
MVKQSPLKVLFKNININVIDIKTDFLLHNVFVLYFFFIVSIFYLFYLSFKGNVLSASIFILIGFLTSFFSKNMIVILFISLTFTYLLQLSDLNDYNLEGFTDKDVEPESDKDVEPDKDPDTEVNKEDVEPDKDTDTNTDTDTIEKDNKPDKPKKAKKIEKTDEDLEKIQEQTQLLLDTHNELMKNIEKMQPYFKLVEVDTKTNKFS